jgi:8-oxo-dGTP diphosphatase
MAHRKEIEILARGVCVKSGHLLLCRTGKAKLTYLPGGHVEFHEPAAEALRREIDEELGLRARVGRFLGVVEHTFLQKGERHCEVNLVFEVEVFGASPKKHTRAMEDHISFEWTPVNALRRSDLEPAPLRAALPQWLASRSGGSRWLSTLRKGCPRLGSRRNVQRDCDP